MNDKIAHIIAFTLGAITGSLFFNYIMYPIFCKMFGG